MKLLLLLSLQPALCGAAVWRMPAPSAQPVFAPALLAPEITGMGLPNAAAPAPGLAPACPAAAPSIAVPVPAAAQVGPLRAPLAARLERRFSALDEAFPLPAASPAALVRRRIRAELFATADNVPEAEAGLLETVAEETDRALAAIQRRLDAGEIDLGLNFRTDPAAAPIEPNARPIKVGVYPVAADPFHWGHLIIALRAVGDLGVDKVVFVLAGDDPRKPAMTPARDRHPMGLEVLSIFAPFFVYSPIASGTQFDGETNIFRLLALNPGVPIAAWYMVGDDHYRLTDKRGGPDTLPKLEANREKNFGHDSALHQLKVLFIKRGQISESVPTNLEVSFIENVGFDSSSTAARAGRHDLIPHTALSYARRQGLYGLGQPASKKR